MAPICQRVRQLVFLADPVELEFFVFCPSEFPPLPLHESFKVYAGNIEVLTYVGNLCRILLELLFRNDRTAFDFGARDNKRIGNGCAFQALLLTDQVLEVRNLEYLRNKLKFSRVRCGKDLLVLFRPRQHIRAYVLPPELIPDFTG